MHDESGRGTDSQVDLNRAGTPLLEIVSQPDLRSAREAALYLDELRLLLVYLGVSDCNMQEGSLRCDANINLHVHPEPGKRFPHPSSKSRTSTASARRTRHRARGQAAVGRLHRDRSRHGDAPKTTRGWDAERGSTYPLRSKEEAADYRYFPDPDLVPVTVTDAEVEAFAIPSAKPPRLAVPAMRRHGAFPITTAA